MSIYQINSLQCEQNVGWRRKVAINLCPLTCVYAWKRKQNENWVCYRKYQLYWFVKLMSFYLMDTSSHSTTSPIECGTFLELCSGWSLGACNSARTLCIALFCGNTHMEIIQLVLHFVSNSKVKKAIENEF